MWEKERVLWEASEGPIFQHLSERIQAELATVPKEKLANAVAALLCRPQPKHMPYSGLVATPVYAAQYYEIFRALDLPHDLVVYEPCVGASNPVILAAEAYSSGHGTYSTVNLNRPLREELQQKIGHLKSSIRIIDDNAQQTLRHFRSNSFDVACFHHAINDILQTAVSEPRGMDTSTVDWWPNERGMIEWLAEDFAAGCMEERGKPELMEIIGHAVDLVRSGGYLVFDHWVWLAHREQDWFPWELFCDLVPMTRRWVADSDLPVVEVEPPDTDPQWWMFLRVEK